MLVSVELDGMSVDWESLWRREVISLGGEDSGVTLTLAVDEVAGSSYCGCGFFQAWVSKGGKRVFTKGKYSKHREWCWERLKRPQRGM